MFLMKKTSFDGFRRNQQFLNKQTKPEVIVMGCSCNQPKISTISVNGYPCKMIGLDAVLYITFLSQPADENEIRSILRENILLYNKLDPSDCEAYVDAILPLYHEAAGEWNRALEK